MRPTEITAKDCKTLADFLTKMKPMTFPQASVMDMVFIVDGIRWLQDLAMAMADGFSKQGGTPPAEAQADVGALVPKAFHPGNVTKTKAKNK